MRAVDTRSSISCVLSVTVWTKKFAQNDDDDAADDDEDDNVDSDGGRR